MRDMAPRVPELKENPKETWSLVVRCIQPDFFLDLSAATSACCPASKPITERLDEESDSDQALLSEFDD